MFTTRPELTGDLGMVASTHWLASSSGMAVLEAGGNAFDAAVAAGFVLHVVEPHLNGPGGDMPLLAWSAAPRGPVRGVWPGRRARGGHARGLRRPRPRPGPRHRPAACVRPGLLRSVDAAAARPRDDAAARGAAVRRRLRPPRIPGPRHHRRHHRPGRGHAHRPLADLARACGCPAGGSRPSAPGSPTPTWRAPWSGSSSRPRPRRPDARSRSRRPGRASTRASSPRRSPSSTPVRRWTSPAPPTAGC